MRLETPLSVLAATSAVVDSLRPDADAKGVTAARRRSRKGEDPRFVADRDGSRRSSRTSCRTA